MGVTETKERNELTLCESLAGGHVSRLKQITRLRQTLVAIVWMVTATSMGYPQALETRRDRVTPVFRVDVWDYTVTDFNNRVWSYFELRSKLEKELPARIVTDDVAEIRRVVRALANRIRVARAEAKQGDIFTPAISTEFRKALLLEMNINTWAAIMDDNPGEFSVQINDSYPEGKPLSTVPPNILALLPTLPDDLQFRFLGRNLVLYDTRANMILDRIPYAIRCRDRKVTRHR